MIRAKIRIASHYTTQVLHIVGGPQRGGYDSNINPVAEVEKTIAARDAGHD
jgi:hypothetical protein